MEADDVRMQQEPASAAGDRRIADQLDALEAERVMQRALELESDSLSEPHVITADQLEKIATEIGLDPVFVHQALGEIRLEPQRRGRFARWVLPQDLVETATARGLTRADFDASIDKWMTQHEGLIKGGLLPDGVEWNVDRRLRSRLLARSISGGNRISRVAGGDLTHRVHSVSGGEHVISLQSHGKWPLTFATLVLTVGIGVASILLLGAVVSSEFLAGIGAFAAITAATAAIAVTGARLWANGIRGALRRSLVGLVSAARPKRKRRFPRFRKQDS